MNENSEKKHQKSKLHKYWSSLIITGHYAKDLGINDVEGVLKSYIDEHKKKFALITISVF